MSVWERTRRVLATTLEVEIVGPDLLREDEPRWDSLKHVAIIFAVEDEFDIRLTEEQMASIDSLGKFVEAVNAA